MVGGGNGDACGVLKVAVLRETEVSLGATMLIQMRDVAACCPVPAHADSVSQG